MNKYVFKPYDPAFPKLFEEEKENLSKALTGDFQIEHVGSTAVPNLGGKGIIDIYIAVDKNKLEQAKSEIERAGYEFRSESSRHHKHFFFKRQRGEQVYHLHLNYPQQDDWKFALVLRDFLKSHPEEVSEYAKVKQKASEEANEDKDKYMDIKSPIMQEILKKALKK